MSDECPKCGASKSTSTGKELFGYFKRDYFVCGSVQRGDGWFEESRDCVRGQLATAQERIERLEAVAEAARALKVVEEQWYLTQDADYCGAVVDAGRLEELHEALAALDEGDERGGSG